MKQLQRFPLPRCASQSFGGGTLSKIYLRAVLERELPHSSSLSTVASLPPRSPLYRQFSHLFLIQNGALPESLVLSIFLLPVSRSSIF